MATIILIHGGLHGGWCWEKLVPRLEALGHHVSAPDLPGMGSDPTPLHEVSLASWARYTADMARAAVEPVLLVGHSRGGIVISEAAEIAPNAVLGLVYVTALLIPRGVSLFSAMSIDKVEHIPGVTVSDDSISMSLDPDLARDGFYHRCSAVDIERALARIGLEPIRPNATPLSVTEERWGQLSRAYVECSDDRTLTLDFQRGMHRVLPCDPVVTMDSDHSPFLSAPGKLAGHLDAIAKNFEHRRRQRSTADRADAMKT